MTAITYPKVSSYFFECRRKIRTRITHAEVFSKIHPQSALYSGKVPGGGVRTSVKLCGLAESLSPL